jgi:MMP 1-O-methyltransferase
MTIDQAVGTARRVQGWMTDDALRMLYRVAERVHHAPVLQVGGWKGRSAIALAAGAAASGRQAITVDHFRGTSSVEHPGVARLDLLREFQANIDNAGLADSHVTLVTDSVTASRLFAPQSLAALLLDGDHDESSVATDLRYWARALRGDGLLLLHDVGNDPRFTWAGPAKLVAELTTHPLDWYIVEQCADLTLLMRRP